MSVNIDKLIESLPENLVFNKDSGKITPNQNISYGTVWGPFEVEKTSVDVNHSQMWNNINILNNEWISFLVEKSSNKIGFTSNLPMSENDEGNVQITLYKKDFQVTLSANEDIEIGKELRCTLVALDHFHGKIQVQNDPPGDADLNNDKMSKTCKFCGINFSHQCTLEAHMTYYCSKRQTLLCESNPTPKCQKTWRTRQRNKQPNSQKINLSFNSHIFSDESTQFKIIDRNISSKHLLNAMNEAEVHQMEKQLNITSPPIPQPLQNKTTPLMNGNFAPKINLNSRNVDSEKISNKIGSNSDSEPETGTPSTLGFCGPCGLFFSSKELYDIHIQLDVNYLKSSIAKCNSLVLAAPVFNNNGLQYVPIHPRTTLINTASNIAQKPKLNVVEDHNSSIPLDLSVNNSSKSPNQFPTDRSQLDAANRAAAAGLTSSNCNNISKSNKRPYLCQHCQTRFQLSSTFQAHQEFYCQGKRQQIEVTEKRSRTISNNSGPNDFEPLTQKSDDINWKVCSQGFKCEGCGFIGQTKRGIRIHCKNQCFKKFPISKPNNKCDDVEVNSPTSDLWGGSNNATAAMESPEHSDFCHQDSPIKIESV